MFTILNKQIIAENTKRIEISANGIAAKVKPGQFVMAMPTRDSPKIPLSIIDADLIKGVLTLIFQEVSDATQKLGSLKINDSLFSVLGPLGTAVEIKSWGKVACIGYGVGIAQILPVSRALRKKENKVIGIISAPSRRSIFLESQMRLACNNLFISTDDGTYMKRLTPAGMLEEILSKEKIHAVYAAGPLSTLENICRVTKESKIKTFVHIETPMLDGVGLCGSCRVKIQGAEVLACVHGPYFDGHTVDFADLINRTKILK